MFTKCFLLLSVATLLVAHRMPPMPLSEGRIVGGKDENIENVPWQVSVQFLGKHRCGGSILNEKIIVTAAHCVSKGVNLVDLFTVRSGSTNHYKGGRVVKVAAFKIHEQYSYPKNSNDIAILLLSEPLNLNSKGARSISLANRTPVAGSHSVVTGWGRIKEENKFPHPILQSAEVDIVDWKQCREAYIKANEENMNITEDMICAAGKGRDACQNDSGGPLVFDGQLVGVVSWGLGCAQPNFPGVYADVSKFRDWIENTAENIVKDNHNL